MPRCCAPCGTPFVLTYKLSSRADRPHCFPTEFFGRADPLSRDLRLLSSLRASSHLKLKSPSAEARAKLLCAYGAWLSRTRESVPPNKSRERALRPFPV